MRFTLLHPTQVHPEPTPYSHGLTVEKADFQKLVFISGQVGLDKTGAVAGGPGDFEAQFVQTFQNIEAVLSAAGGELSDIVSMRSFLIDAQDLPTFHELRKRYYPRFFPYGHPTNTLLIVSGLFRKELRLEVEAIAALR